MHFSALRVVCPNCDAAFIVGGSAPNDLTRWWGSVVECRSCGAETSAAAGRPIELHPSLAAPKVDGVVAEPCHA